MRPSDCRHGTSKLNFRREVSCDVKYAYVPQWLILCVGLALSPHAEPASGVITGRVVDDDGRPMRGLQVMAVEFGDRGSPRSMVPRTNGAATTNDRGEFRLFWLDPGKYYVVVNPNPLDPIRIQGGRLALGYFPSDPDAAFVTTYFPGTANVDEAEPVDVGRDEVDIHAIQVAALPSHLIRIQAVKSQLSETNPYVGLLLIRPAKEAWLDSAIFPSLPRPVGNGQFELRTGLMPGDYRVLLEVRSPGKSYLGSAPVTIGRGDPATISIPVSRTASVQGQVEFAGDATSLKVVAVPDRSNSSALPVLADVRQTGKFVLEDVLPGAYSISVVGLKSDAYLDSPTNVIFPEDTETLRLTLRIKQDRGK